MAKLIKQEQLQRLMELIKQYVANAHSALITTITDAFAAKSHTHTGSQVKMTGYSTSGKSGAVAAADDVNTAVAKVENKAKANETSIGMALTAIDQRAKIADLTAGGVNTPIYIDAAGKAHTISSVSEAQHAETATKDALGNTIATTYAKKTDLAQISSLLGIAGNVGDTQFSDGMATPAGGVVIEGGTRSKASLKAGDVVIQGGFEYICDNTPEKVWHKFGDDSTYLSKTSAEGTYVKIADVSPAHSPDGTLLVYGQAAPYQIIANISGHNIRVGLPRPGATDVTIATNEHSGTNTIAATTLSQWIIAAENKIAMTLMEASKTAEDLSLQIGDEAAIVYNGQTAKSFNIALMTNAEVDALWNSVMNSNSNS